MYASRKQIKLLVADDNDAAREALACIMQRRGFAVSCARDGQEALEYIASDIPDVIILDISMPRMDGIETCRRLRRDPATCSIPVIFLSAQQRSNVDAALYAMPGPPIEYLDKPCDVEILLKQIAAFF